jgi:hypothetical protein
MMRPTSHGNSSPGSRTQDHREDDVVTSTGTINSLRDGKTIGIIGDPNFAFEHPTQICFD